ncbi:WD40 repeat domain-containing protein, partial [candidate division KSB1 bacterium]|nr:WD40 repeat domain-containing protein [candidate division KSB1 bacterium]
MKCKLTVVLLASCYVLSPTITHAQTSKPALFTAEYQSYLAHIAAANASLRLNEAGEAKRWLVAAPEQWRNWEWRYLNARSDNSMAKMTLDATADEAHFSADGKMLIAAMHDNSIRIYEANTLQEMKRLVGHRNAVYAAKFTPDGARIVSCSRDTTIRVWNFASGALEWQAKSGGHGLADIDVSPDGNTIAFCSWYFEKGKGVLGLVSLWDMAGGKEIWRTHYDTHPLVDIRFSPGGNLLAVGSWQQNVGIWNLEDKTTPRIFSFDDAPAYSAVDDIAFSPDGRFIAAATKNGTPRVWEVESGALRYELRGHQQPVFAIGFSTDGRRIFTGGAEATIMMWDAENGKLLKKSYGHENKINSLAFDQHSERFVTASSDSSIRMWSANYGGEYSDQRGRSKEIYAFSLSRDGALLATSGPEATISIWDAKREALRKNFPGLNKAVINAAAFSPDGSRLVACNWDTLVKIWNVQTGAVERELRGLQGGSSSCAFSPDGK